MSMNRPTKGELRARSKEVEQAATDWIEAKRRLMAVKDADAALRRAAATLKAWCRETGHSTIEVPAGTVGYSLSSATVLDVDKVEAELGDRLKEFQKTQARETLSLLGER